VKLASGIERYVTFVKFAVAQLLVTIFEAEIVLHSCVYRRGTVLLHSADAIADTVVVAGEME
jgi:hypothetical protein